MPNNRPSGELIGKSRAYFYSMNPLTYKLYLKYGNSDAVKGYYVLQSIMEKLMERVRITFIYIAEERNDLVQTDLIECLMIYSDAPNSESLRNSVRRMVEKGNATSNIVLNKLRLEKIVAYNKELIEEAENFYNSDT